VIVFPEGTRFPARSIGPFKAGAFVLARAAHVPVVPVGIVGSAERMEARRLYTTPGVVGLRIGDPIPPEQFEDDDAALAERVRGLVAALAGPSAARLALPSERGRRNRDQAATRITGDPGSGAQEPPAQAPPTAATESTASDGGSTSKLAPSA
jgi:1-acyl-sn-glycerol-3-phosphate acyltransferase